MVKRSMQRFVDNRLSMSRTVIDGKIGEPPSDVGAVSREDRCLMKYLIHEPAVIETDVPAGGAITSRAAYT